MALPVMAQTGTAGTTGSNDLNGTPTNGTTNNGSTTTTDNGTYNNGSTTTDNGTSTTTGGTYDNGTTTGTTTTTVTGTETVPGATTGTGYSDGNTRIVNGQQVPSNRTNPNAPSHSPNGGMTATGTIVSWNHNELVLHTSTGINHFKMMPSTTGYTTNFQEGQVAAVDFERNEQGVMIAKQVRLGASTRTTTGTLTTAPADTTSGTTTTDTTNNNTASTYPSTTDTTTSTYPSTTDTTSNTTDTTASTATDTTTGTTSGTRMPATASESPLVALLGLLALAGAAGLRRL